MGEEMVFASIGMMLMFGVAAYVLYWIANLVKDAANKEYRYDILERCLLNKVALKKGIDIEKEITRLNVMQGSKFKRRLHDEMYKEMFGKE